MARLPSPAMCVALASMVVAMGGAGYSATGGNFILGQPNNATSLTSLTAPFAGKALRVDNTSTAAAATALGLFVTAGHAPFTVNSTVKVANLNADKLDGIDSTSFPRVLRINWGLPANALSAPITLPVLNQPIHLMGIARRPQIGIGHVTLFSNAGLIKWVGQEAATGIATKGSSATPGAHILYLDNLQVIDVEVSSASAIRIRNASGDIQSGVLTLMW